MIAPTLPPNEAERLADLHDDGVLDTPAEKIFNEIAELAAAICGSRYAAVTLIDSDRQWFKAEYGSALGETSRAESICGHAILEQGVFEVPDTELDERFVGNPMLANANIRFYTGSPLTSIHGAVKLLEGGAAGVLPEPATRLVALAARNSERLRVIVDDILDLEKIASGRMEFNIESLDAPAALGRAAQAYEAMLRTAGVELTIEAHEAHDALQLKADAQRLDQVLANLVSNALKFAPQGSRILLEASREGSGVRLQVTDHGAGIPEAFRARFFQRFAQADMNTSRPKGGSGLGLSIAKQMIEQMGGSIGYSSEPGRTCFHVVLPAVP